MSFENGRVVRVVLRASTSTFEHVNVLHYDLDDGSIPGEANNPQALADFFRDNVIVRYIQLFNVNWVIHPVVVEDEIDPLDRFAPRSAWSSGAEQPGVRPTTGDALPPGLVVMVALKSNTIGRRFNGRMWLGGQMLESDQVGGTWGTSITSIVDELVANIPRQPDIAGGAGTAVANWAIYSRTARAAHGTHYLAHGIVPRVDPKVHWLRSRSVFSA